MTRRLFVSNLASGLSSVTSRVERGRPQFSPTVTFGRDLPPADGQAPPAPPPFAGPDFAVLGPGDVTGFDAGVVLRCTPSPGTTDAMENYLATVDLTDARLPWLLTLPGMRGRPWLTLIVLRDDEGDLRAGDPLPTVEAPAGALPHPDDLALWAHVEARVEDGEDLTAVLRAEAHVGTDRVVARLVCPRRLQAHRSWLACVVPTTQAGRLAGLGQQWQDGTPGQPGAPAWDPGGSAVLPVYHSWRFSTGEEGSFEDLARLVEPRHQEGLGTRTIGVGRPWPHADLIGGTPDAPTITMHGALRPIPPAGQPDEPPGAEEEWSDGPEKRDHFRSLLGVLLDAPALRAADDRDEGALAPPLLGSHHSGHQAVPAGGWMEQLNLQVRHRLAASLGARYVQLEQEFLMQQAWEQVGAIREANRLLAATELAAESSILARDKHVSPLAADVSTLATLAAPVADDVMLSDGSDTVAGTLHRSAVPDGVATVRFRRLARRGGALDRRTTRAARPAVDAGFDMAAAPVVAAGLAGVATVPLQPVEWVTATASDAGATAGTVAVDGASGYGAVTLQGLLDAQQTVVADRVQLAPQAFVDSVTILADDLGTMGGGMGAAGRAEATSVAAPLAVRELRTRLALVAPSDVVGPAPDLVDGDLLGGSIVQVLDSLPDRVERLNTGIVGMVTRAVEEVRPLRPIMAHPRFGYPIGAELLTRWPEWTLPGITTFPDDSCTLLETNPPFVVAAVVGLNQEFNRELLWREYPTDQVGTPFTRFWPGSMPDFGEIALWADADPLGGHDPSGGTPTVTFLVRAEVIRRFPGSLLLAAKADQNSKLITEQSEWREPRFTLPVDDRTTIFGFDLTRQHLIDEPWLFVLREPMRGTQFGFDLPLQPTPAQPDPEQQTPATTLRTWSDLTWDGVPRDREFAAARTPRPGPDGQPRWGATSADVAAIAFQRPFQVAYSPTRLIEERA